MPRRKQICPKRMKYDGKGEEIEDNTPDSNSPSADDQSESETSPMGSPGSPSEPRSPGNERNVDDEEEGDNKKSSQDREDQEDQEINEDQEILLPNKRPRIMDPVGLEHGFPMKNNTDSMTRMVVEETKGSQIENNSRPKSPPTLESVDNYRSQSLRMSSPGEPDDKEVFSHKLSAPPLLTKSSDQCHPLEPENSHRKSSDRDHVKDRDIPKLVPSVKNRSESPRPVHTDKHKHKSDIYRDYMDKHRSRHSSLRRERARDHRHHRDSLGARYHSDREPSATKSLAKKYADLFRSSTSVKTEGKSSSVKKEDKSGSHYEPLKAVQDMVKAAERRSPVTPPHGGSYHSRFDYLKRLTGSPSSLEALQRVVDKDRTSVPEKRPSVVQSVSKTFSSSYHKYLPPAPPTKRETSPPPRTPDIDPDKPLDLSVKAKKPSDPAGSHSSRRTRHDSVPTSLPYLSPNSDLSSPSMAAPVSRTSPGGNSMAMSMSTLASLEQKFGDDSFMFDRIGSKHFNTPIRQFYMSAFGMGIYSTALNNSYPFPGTNTTLSSATGMISQSLQASGARRSSSRDGSPSPARKSSTSSMPPPSEDTSKSYVPSKFLEQAMKEPCLDPKKHTNLQCSCGADFETLYQLTLHLQDTGHPANKTKNGTQHEYPKLVRGQDMWLNHGSEQTKQILRCMQCGESFKSLPELTVHMIQTKHYTNIVGTEPPPRSLKPPKSSMSVSDSSDTEFSPPHKCPKCKELFEDFEGLIQHQDKTGHLIPKLDPDLEKSEMMTPPRPASRQSDKESGAASRSSNGSIVHLKRRLLDSLNTDRADNEGNFEEDSRDSSYSSHSAHESSRIRCENCGDKIHTEHFVEHVRLCVKNMRSPGRARSRSRSRSPIEKKYLNYHVNDYHFNHFKKESKDEEKYSRSKDYLSAHHDLDKSSFPYPYRDYRPQMDSKKEMKMWSHSKECRPEPDSSQGGPRDFTINSSTELVTPPETDKDGCALKAMECFIERSFTHNTARKPVQSSSLFSSSLFARNFFASHSSNQPGPPRLPERPSRLSPVAKRESPSPKQHNSHLYQNKYLPPLYASESPMANDKEQQENNTQVSPVSKAAKEEPLELSSKVSLANGLDKTPDKNDNTVLDTTAAIFKKHQFLGNSDNHDYDETPKSARLVSEPKNLSITPKDLSKKYIADKPSNTEEVEPKEEVEDKSSSSALQSLQGLVYGKSFNTEHPLDSLQKLIHTASSTPTSHTATTSSRTVLSPSLVPSGATTTSLPTTLPGTVILVNPIVTVVANSKGGSPSLQISLPPPGSPGDGKEPHSPLSNDSSNNHENRSPGPGNNGESNEHHCDACNRNFNSKGSYRYHQSRCHWSTVKKFRIKEAINTSPYVYLPLDHSAKFNKYYEMANELAGKSK